MRKLMIMFYPPLVSAQSSFQIAVPTGLGVRDPGSGNIGNIVNFVITLLVIVGIIGSIIWLLYGGIKYVTSGGDKGAVEQARGHIIAALVGLIIVLFTFVIISLVISTIGGGPGLGQINFQLPPL